MICFSGFVILPLYPLIFFFIPPFSIAKYFHFCSEIVTRHSQIDLARVSWHHMQLIDVFISPISCLTCDLYSSTAIYMVYLWAGSKFSPKEAVKISTNVSIKTIFLLNFINIIVFSSGVSLKPFFIGIVILKNNVAFPVYNLRPPM